MSENLARPLGDSTTVLDLADRDNMDDDMFPLATDKSWFTRDVNRRCLNFSPVIQEFTHIGSLEFGGRLMFEIGSIKSCDLLFTVALQLRLGHWLPPDVIQKLQTGQQTYQDPDSAWYYANSLGTSIIAKAELLLEDQVLETVDGDFGNVFGLLYSDVNTQLGVGVDANGRAPQQILPTWRESNVFPTTNGIISCILPFSFQRIRLRNPFPLTSCKEGTVRVRITLRPFSQCVRRQEPALPPVCNDSPLGKTFTFIETDVSGAPIDVVAAANPPPFLDARLVTQGMVVDGKLRNALLHAPFDRLQRDLHTFRFDEPKKQVVNTPSNGTVRLQLPLEINGPIEEILWFVRRKAVSINNEWTNQSNRLWFEIDSQNPPQSMLVAANLQVNGISLVEQDGEFFRREAAKRHRGGIASQSNFVQGQTFAQNPARQNPSGWMNASRSQDVRLRVDIKPPGGSEDLEFEVVVFVLNLNWVRFQNGIANVVFSS